MLKKITIIAFMFILYGCSHNQYVKNIDKESIPSFGNDNNVSLSEIKNTILLAAQKRGWKPRVISPNAIEAEIKVRNKHKATVKITYTKKSYSIEYQDSVNLNYSNGKIHKNYNGWVSKLDSSIQKELGIKALE